MPKVSDAHRAARRRQILDAAGRCFARDGFHRTSMQDIVRESGISAGLVYRYFTGKDDVIAAIVTEWHDQRAALLSGDTLDDRAAAYLDYLRSVGRPENAALLRLGVQVWAEALRDPAILALSRRNVDDPRAATAAALRDHLPPGADPDALARVLIAIYQGLVLQTAWDGDVDNEAYVRAVRALLDGLLPGS
nr:TetR/AcrR family transcriptional regulator [uncultured Actinoplanes sp.]